MYHFPIDMYGCNSYTSVSNQYKSHFLYLLLRDSLLLGAVFHNELCCNVYKYTLESIKVYSAKMCY